MKPSRRLKIYFACAITGGRQDERVYQAIVDAMLAAGCEVPTAELAGPEVTVLEARVDPAEVFRRDIDWIAESDALVAEVSTPSHGVGFEIAYALAREKPVLACYRLGKPVSKMLLGNPDPNLRCVAYRDVRAAVTAVRKFLSALEKESGV